jgi:hypothetical protein
MRGQVRRTASNAHQERRQERQLHCSSAVIKSLCDEFYQLIYKTFSGAPRDGASARGRRRGN